jgi:lysylphosphatidylglycerol synthetase-like protein (DUF2156 family)
VASQELDARLIKPDLFEHFLGVLAELGDAPQLASFENPASGDLRMRGHLIEVEHRLGGRAFVIESLYRFNAKFFPRWEPRYLLYEGALGLPRAAGAQARRRGRRFRNRWRR